MTDGTAGRAMTRRAVLGLFGAALAHRRDASAAETSPDVDRAALVTANNAFGLDLYGRLRGAQGNLFCSPFSVSSALAMALVGARGATADEMASTLRLSLEGRRLHTAFAALARNLTDGTRAAELYVANALWSRRGYPLVADFKRVAKTSYGAATEEVDFERAPETARRTINAWVEQQTHDRIRELLKEGVLQPDTVLVLTNAIYLKAAWMHPFPEALTASGAFALGGKAAARDVPFMRQSEVYRFLDGGTFQALDLPYRAGELSMVVFLPRAIDGLADFERSLTAARVTDWVAQMTPHYVDVALPRFKVTATYTLKQPLADLGMSSAFSPVKANFSGMVQVQRVFLSVVAHKAYVDVNERGTEAGAATAIAAKPTSMPRPFHASHPFFFLIRDNRAGCILFTGRLANPQAI